MPFSKWKKRNPELQFDRPKDHPQEGDALGPDVQRRDGGGKQPRDRPSEGMLQAWGRSQALLVCASPRGRGRRGSTKVNFASDLQCNKECLRHTSLPQGLT